MHRSNLSLESSALEKEGGACFGHLLKQRLYPPQLCPVDRNLGEGCIKTNYPKKEKEEKRQSLGFGQVKKSREEIISQQRDYFLSNTHSCLIWGGVCLQCAILFSICFSAVCPFIIPLLVKINKSFFPSDVTDFFMSSISKIKQDREKETYKVSKRDFASSCGRKYT